ncbi:LamG domain-containing protein [Marinobacter segnicrescens]|uniref:LamG domain-containing protein n=1 Tax=Marinobacter segnicrescens TaxID=430453 RepID=UPI003A953CAA
MTKKTRFYQPLLTALTLSLLALAGCNSGESTESLPNTQSPGTSQYNGPAPATADVQAFKINVWDNLSLSNRCGECHNSSGQSPRFAHEGDVNVAYAQANQVVNLNDPGRSALVTKVAGGHNCWLGSDQACADAITSMISSWAGGSSGSVNRIELQAPALRDPGGTLPFPESSAAFSTTVYPLLTTYCSSCHADGDTRPYLASGNVDTAYDAAKSRMSLTAPFSSRLVERLRDDRHNCWNNSCEFSANEMESAIESLAGTVTPSAVDPDLVTSKALTLDGDGLLANSGGRYEDHVIALYEFKTGEGNTAFDTSGIEPSMHLSLTGNVEWVGGYGISFGPAFSDNGFSVRNGKAQATTGNSRKLHDLLTASGEYSLEAWLVPANVTQEDARIVSYSGSATDRNLTLGQTLQNYEILQRSTTTDQNAVFSTEDGANRLQASLQHVVINFTPDQGRRIFINGEATDDVDPAPGGLLSSWDDNFALVMGNETDGNSPWEGTLRLVAFHNRALSPAQVRTNFEAGVGQKYYLLFGLSHLVDVPQAFMVFEVSQFDSYSYLFAEPFFISLDDEASPGSIPLAGMKLGVNGRETLTGQAWSRLDTTLNDGDYVAGRGQVLSRQGTIIPLEGGPEADEFFLSFSRLGDHENVVVEGALPPPPALPNLPAAPDVGLKNFDAINATMSKLTGVPVTNSQVRDTFETVREQLPSVANIEGFLSSQQMAITQMAIGYCNELVDDISLRGNFFPGFNFNAAAGTAFTPGNRDLVTNPLIDTMVGSNLDTQPLVADLEGELDDLMDSLTACGGSCEADRTATVVKASCAAVLGSATTLIH